MKRRHSWRICAKNGDKTTDIALCLKEERYIEKQDLGQTRRAGTTHLHLEFRLKSEHRREKVYVEV